MNTKMFIANAKCHVEFGDDAVKITGRFKSRYGISDVSGVAEAAGEMFSEYLLSRVEWQHVQGERWQDSWDSFKVELVKR